MKKLPIKHLILEKAEAATTIDTEEKDKTIHDSRRKSKPCYNAEKASDGSETRNAIEAEV